MGEMAGRLGERQCLLSLQKTQGHGDKWTQSPSGLKGDDSEPKPKQIAKTKPQLQRACAWTTLPLKTFPESRRLSRMR